MDKDTIEGSEEVQMEVEIVRKVAEERGCVICGISMCVVCVERVEQVQPRDKQYMENRVRSCRAPASDSLCLALPAVCECMCGLEREEEMEREREEEKEDKRPMSRDGKE